MHDPGQETMKKGAIMAVEYAEGVNDNMAVPHFHDYFEIYYLKSGHRSHYADGDFIEIHPQEIILFPPYSMHYSYGDEDVPFARVVVYFKKSAILFPELIPLLSQGVQTYAVKDKARPFLEFLFREKTGPDALSEDFCISILNAFLIDIVRTENQIYQRPANDPFTEILEYINQHYMEELSLDVLSAKFYMSASVLSRKFKKAVQTNFSQYLQKVRIMHAQKQILEGTQSMTEIAISCGFSSVVTFNRTFKSIMSLTPTEFKKQGIEHDFSL